MPKLTQNQKDRITVAKDVIASVESGWYDCERIAYVDLQPKHGKIVTDADVKNNKELRDILPKRVKKCNVCAKGAMLISTIMCLDNFPAMHDVNCVLFGKAWSNNYVSPFSAAELENMEASFEGGLGNCYYDYPDRNNRLVAMMENVIKNKGTFKP